MTDTCDLNCYYCHNEGQEPNGNLMTPAEIERILEIARILGLTKVKFTGGEPLLRNDIIEIIQRAKTKMDEVSLTTHGARLSDCAAALKNAGLARVNVSLDSFDPERYREITGKDTLTAVLDGINQAVKVGLDPVKVNIVALPDSTTDDLLTTVRATWEMGAVPQLIELVSKGKTRSSLGEVEDWFTRNAFRIHERDIHKRRRYMIRDEDGNENEVEIVRPMHNSEFCTNCTRLRVTSGGMIKPCLMHNEGTIDVLTSIRNGGDDNELLDLFKQAIHNRRPYWK